MNSPSDEQQIVINYIKTGHNAIVDAVAGSGKSTTILSIAAAMPKHKIIQFTYNSMLRFEIKHKAKQLNLNNLHVHTYHSLAVKYFHSSAFTDTGIRHIINKSLSPRIHIPKKDIIVIDESQDMTPLYFAFVIHYIKHMNHPFQLLVLGDFMQGLYDFKGADTRFLTLAIEIWKNHKLLKSNVFHYTTLKTSYRITHQMADFINVAMLDETRLVAQKYGPINVHYIRNSQRNIENSVVYAIFSLFNSGNATPADIFILGPSVKGPNSPMRRMENILVSRGFPCFVPSMDTDNIDDKVSHNKIVFSTFHSVKGRQRKYVFIVGFDQGYMRFYGKNLPNDLCPSTLYVACTRATEGLYLLERDDFETDKPLEFLKISQFEMKKLPFVTFKGTPYYPLYDVPIKNNPIQKHYITPSNLIKFIPESVLESITPILESMFHIVKQKTTEIDIPSVIQTSDGFFEDVSDLNGIAIPAMYYDHLTHHNKPNVLYETILIILDEFKTNEHEFLKNIVSQLPATFTEPADYLFLANVYSAFQEKLYSKLKQIHKDDYNWINTSMMNQCKRRLETFIGKECIGVEPLIESTIIHQSQESEHESIDTLLAEYFDETLKFRFTARTDIITPKTIWELKCVKEITMDHQLQVVIYAWLYGFIHPNHTMLFKILNVRTCEIQQLIANKEHLDFIVISLLQGKYARDEKPDNDTFISICHNIIDASYN